MGVYVKKSVFDLSQVKGRVKYIRRLMGVTQKELVALGVGATTLARIESGDKQITIRQANSLSLLAKEKSVFCSPAWIMTGESVSPYVFTPSSTLKIHIPFQEEYNNPRLLQQIVDFKKINPGALISLIKDESMIPMFNLGDYVGGFLIEINQTHDLYKAYIVELKNGLQLVRSIKKLPDNKLKLISSNPCFDSTEHVVSTEEIHALHPIVWHIINAPYQ